MAPQATPQDIAQHPRLLSPGSLLALLPCQTPGLVQHLLCTKVSACARSCQVLVRIIFILVVLEEGGPGWDRHKIS